MNFRNLPCTSIFVCLMTAMSGCAEKAGPKKEDPKDKQDKDKQDKDKQDKDKQDKDKQNSDKQDSKAASKPSPGPVADKPAEPAQK